MGSDPSLLNVYGHSSLILSAQFGYEEMAKMLLEYELHHNNHKLPVHDLQGMVALHWSCLRGHLGVTNLLICELGGKNNGNSGDTVKMMIDTTDAFGRTPSMLAASSGNLQSLQVRCSNHFLINSFYNLPSMKKEYIY